MARLYVPLDVNFPDDDKIEAVGLDGAGLYAMSLCLAKRLLDDGRLTRVKLRKLGGDDALIDRLIDVGLYTAVADDAVRISAWLGHNVPAESVLTSDKAKRLAHQRHHVNTGKSSPDCRFCAGEEPQVNAEICESDAGRIETQCADALPEVEVETEIPSTSLRTTPVETAPDPSHDVEQAVAAPDEQAIRKTAALVGRSVAAAQVGIANPSAYAAGVTRQILDTTGDGIDRERIIRLLGAGDTPEGIASGWATDPFGFPAVSEPVLVGPDTAGFYAEREARRREQMAEQVPVDTVDGLAGLRAAREALRKPVAS